MELTPELQAKYEKVTKYVFRDLQLKQKTELYEDYFYDYCEIDELAVEVADSHVVEKDEDHDDFLCTLQDGRIISWFDYKMEVHLRIASEIKEKVFQSGKFQVEKDPDGVETYLIAI